MVKLFLLVFVLGTGMAHSQDYYTLTSVEVSKVETDVLNQEISEKLSFSNLQQVRSENKGIIPLSNVGLVIAASKELVALGEGLYHLVQKGKPSNTTTYAPISVIPKDGSGSYVDIFDTENWDLPKKSTYIITYKNLYGMSVVVFRYSVLFAYGGTYKGKGAYITAAQIIPESVLTSFGFNFSATMQLGGIVNHGTKENPVAGAIMAMEYRVETFLQARLESASYHITGHDAVNQL